jgi:hypothetical protein
MCRYAFHNYKDHFACFRCRKTFKHYLWCEAPWGRRSRGPTRITRVPLCPECRQPMADLGLDFRAPRQNDRKQWRKVELLYQRGVAFHNCGCGAGPRPTTLRQVRPFLSARLPVSNGARLLRAIAER